MAQRKPTPKNQYSTWRLTTSGEPMNRNAAASSTGTSGGYEDPGSSVKNCGSSPPRK